MQTTTKKECVSKLGEGKEGERSREREREQERESEKSELGKKISS